MCFLAYADAVGRAPVAVGRPKVGIKWAHMGNDVKSAAAEIRRGELSVFGWLRSLENLTEYAYCSKDDVLPGLLEVVFRCGARLRDLVKRRPWREVRA